MKIRLDLAEILRISKLDWRDGGGKEKKGRNPPLLLRFERFEENKLKKWEGGTEGRITELIEF